MVRISPLWILWAWGVVTLFAAPRTVVAQGVSLDEAEHRAAHLTKLLKKRKTPTDALVEAVASVERAYRVPPPDAEKKDLARARRAMRRALLRALAIPGASREPVAYRAARAVRWLEPAARRELHTTIERKLFDTPPYGVSYPTWEALCDSILLQDPVAGYTFLVEEVVHPDTDTATTRRTHAALVALAAAPLPPAKVRYETLKRLLAIFQSYPFHVEEDYDYVADFRNVNSKFKRKLARHGVYWAEMRPLVLRMLRRMTTDPVTGAQVLDVDSGLEIESLERFKVWNGRNKLRPIAQWKREPGSLPRTTLRPVRATVREFGLRWTLPWTDRWPLPSAPEDAPAAEGRKQLRETRLPIMFEAALADPAPEVRGMAAVMLGRLRTPKAVDALRERLTQERDEIVREAVALGLLYLADAKLRDWWRALAADGSENPQIRAIALLALAFLGDVDFLRQRVAQGGRPKTEVELELRATAVAGIGLAGDGSDAPMLARLLHDHQEKPPVFGAAAAALARLGTPAEAPKLIAHLRGARVRTKDPRRAAAVAHALGGALRPTDAKSMRSAARIFLRAGGKFAAHRTELALSLGRVGGPAALKLLVEGYEDCRKDGDRAAEIGYFLLAIGMTREARAEAHLGEALRELDHEFDAAACALAIARAGALHRAPALNTWLGPSRRIFVGYGIEALGRLGDVAALPAIRKRIEEGPRDQTLAPAALALARIRGSGAAAELMRHWERAASRRDYAALARAIGLAGPDGTERALQEITTDRAARSARERAFAWAALGRMARPDDAIHERLRGAWFPYGAPRTLTRLARFGDSFFLAATDE